MRRTKEELKKLSCALAIEMSHCGPLQNIKGSKGQHTYIFGFEVSKASKILLKELLKLNQEEKKSNTKTIEISTYCDCGSLVSECQCNTELNR